MAMALLTMVSGVFAEVEPNVTKAVLLRSKEMKPHTVRELVNEETGKVYSGSDDKSLYEDFDKGMKISSRDVEKSVYEEFWLKIRLSYSEDTKSFLNNPYLQEDLAKLVLATDKYSDSLAVALRDENKDAKSLDDVIDKLSRTDGYDVFVLDSGSAEFDAELNRYPNSKKETVRKNLNISVAKGIVKTELGRFSTGSGLSEIYDAETGNRIQLLDLITTLKVKKSQWSEDSVTLVRVRTISKDEIGFDYESSWVSFKKDDSLLTDYARSLMARDKGYTVTTNTNAYGDKIRDFSFEHVDDSFNPWNILVPMELKGCSNTKKIRNRMLEVMFGRNDGDLEILVTEGSKNWIVNGVRKLDMSLKTGEGLVSFSLEKRGYKDHEMTFLTFDKKNGNEISVNDLIKDKKGFMKFVNSHNVVGPAFFLMDSTKKEQLLQKFGEDFRTKFRYSGGFNAPFGGMTEFPSSWSFPFDKMDDAVLVVFYSTIETNKMKIKVPVSLDYADIKKFINPKYIKVLDQAAKSIKKE